VARMKPGAAATLSRKRTELKTKMEGEEHWTKRSKNSGQFMAQKKDDAKFKGVRK
jgi:hypothetical protein